MKFQKSQRSLFAPNYNPPCNVYQPDFNAVTKRIMTGSLAVPSLGNRNTFGYGERFQTKIASGPGPAAYTVDARSKSLVNLMGRQRMSVGRIKNDESKPSIPFSYYGQNEGDQEEQAYIKYILLNEDVQSSHKAIQKKQPSFTFPKCARSKHETQQFIPQDQQLFFQKVQEKQPLKTKKMSCVIRQKIKQSTENRLHAIQALQADFVPSLELIQIIKKKKNNQIPGPGAYIKEEEENVQFQFYQNPKGASFTSVKRFQSDSPSLVGPGLYNPRHVDNTKNFSFCRSNRNVLFEKKDISNFRFYINPEKNQQLNKNQQRASSCPFGSTESRFPQSIHTEEPRLTLKQQIERTKNTKINKLIQQKLKLHRKNNEDEKNEGLLALSTMASTID